MPLKSYIMGAFIALNTILVVTANVFLYQSRTADAEIARQLHLWQNRVADHERGAVLK